MTLCVQLVQYKYSRGAIVTCLKLGTFGILVSRSIDLLKLEGVEPLYDTEVLHCSIMHQRTCWAAHAMRM